MPRAFFKHALESGIWKGGDMREQTVGLMADGFNSWKDRMQRCITRIKDLLSVLEVEEQKLSAIWESSAKELWDKGFQKELGNLRDCILDIEGLIFKAGEMAEKLAQTESRLIKAAEEIK